jgi:hypothetical protein
MAKKPQAKEVSQLENPPLEKEEELKDPVDEKVLISDVKIPLKKLGHFENNWVESMSATPNGLDKVYRSIHAGTVVQDQAEIERLVSIGAPIKVYVEHVSN